MTLTVAPTVGAIAIGQIVNATSVMPGTTITGLASGTMNAVSSTYTLSTTPGTIVAAAMSTTSVPLGNVVVQQLTSTMPNGALGGSGTYQLALANANQITNAQLSYGWVVNAFAGRKCKLIGGTGQSQEFTINSNTNSTLAMTAITTAPVTAITSYAILQAPVRGIGIALNWFFGTSDTASRGKYMGIARGGAVVGFDRLDLTTDKWNLMPITPQLETLGQGSMYAYDGGDRLYFTKDVTQRMYYIDFVTNTVHGAGLYPYAAGTTIIGNRMEIFTTADGVKYLWLNRHSAMECYRQLLFY
jgi:hypothetical protein